MTDSAPLHQTTGPDYGIEICRHCDPVRPQRVGPEVESRCPECGAPLFGLLGTEVERETPSERHRRLTAKMNEANPARHPKCGAPLKEPAAERPERDSKP